MKRILIIESDSVLRAIYRSKFDLAGFAVEAVDDAPNALGKIPNFRPHLIQLDLSLKSMSGPALIRQIRAMPGFMGVPIVVLSSFYRPDLVEEAFDAGATKCVSKTDCTASQALEIVDRIFNSEMSGFDTDPPFAPAEEVLPGESVAQPSLQAPPMMPSPTVRPSPSLLSSQGQAPRLINPSLLPKSSPSPGLPVGPSLLGIPRENSPVSAARLPAFLPPPATQRHAAPPANAPPVISDPPNAAPISLPPDEPFPPAPIPGIEEMGQPEFGSENTTYFRRGIRQEFFSRVPQIQADLRERVGALVRSKNPTEQLALLRGFNPSISSLVGLAGITGFSRIAHLAGAMEALIRDLQERPQQLNSSVLRTIAHASDCLNILFRDIHQDTQEIPQSLWILAVDDDPVSRRTIAVALGKANLRCLAIAEPKMAMNILIENQFDLIFLDADMPEMNGFEVCAALRKMAPHKTTPVIFVTGLTNFEVRAQSSLAGANDLIAKPFLMMELAVKALTYLLRPK